MTILRGFFAVVFSLEEKKIMKINEFMLWHVSLAFLCVQNLTCLMAALNHPKVFRWFINFGFSWEFLGDEIYSNEITNEIGKFHLNFRVGDVDKDKSVNSTFSGDSRRKFSLKKNPRPTLLLRNVTFPPHLAQHRIVQ